jgi:hypothetical protein
LFIAILDSCDKLTAASASGCHTGQPFSVVAFTVVGGE